MPAALSAQISFECLNLDEWELPGEETLCEEIDDFDSSPIEIGTYSGSLTYWSQTGLGFPYPFGVAFEDIHIQGTLIIDSPAGFYRCRVKMGDDAKIVILDSKYLFSYFTDWFSCSTLWEGIEIDEGGSIRSYYSRYEDAKYLITADDGSILALYGNEFNRNYVGIRNGTSSGSYEGMIFNLFQQNTFSCTNELNETINFSDISMAGIWLEKGVAHVGHYFSPNYFNYLKNGIILESSTAILTNLHFSNILIGFSSDDGGRGILAKNSNLEVRALSYQDAWNGRSSFHNCQVVGIESIGSNLHVEAATFGGDMYGAIEVRGNKAGQTVQVEYCSFDLENDNTIGALIIQRGVASGSDPHYLVRYDTIYVDNISPGFGIFATGEFPAIDKVIVDSNYIVSNEETTENGKGAKMILIAGSVSINDGYIVSNNIIETISEGYEDKRYSIYFFNFGEISDFSHQIVENTITSNNSKQNVQCGIHIEGAKNVYLCDNFLDLTRRGIHLAGMNDTLVLRNTSFNTHERGLYITVDELGAEGINGPQVRNGNLWSSVQTDYKLFAAECTEEPLFNRFIVEDDDPTLLPPKRTPGGTDWFIEIDGELNYCVSPSDHTPGIFIVDSLLIFSSYIDNSYSEAIWWTLKKQLILKLMRFDELRPPSSAPATYFNNRVDSTYSEHAEVEYGFFNAMLYTDSLQCILDSIHDLSQSALLSLSYVDSARVQTIDTLNLDSTAMNAAIYWLDSLKVLVDSLDAQRQRIMQDQYTELNSLLSAANNLPDSETYEAKSKTILQIVIKAALYDSIGSGDIDILKSLAEESADTSGGAVLDAQVLYLPCQNLNLGYEPSVEQGFSEEPILYKVYKPSAKKVSMRVLENPASEVLTVQWTAPVTGSLILYDMAGRSVFSSSVQDAKEYRYKITDEIREGTYFLLFEGVSGIILSNKLIILKG